MAEETPEKTRQVLRDAAEKCRGRMVSVHADDLLEALDVVEDKQPAPAQPDKIET